MNLLKVNIKVLLLVRVTLFYTYQGTYLAQGVPKEMDNFITSSGELIRANWVPEVLLNIRVI